MELKRDLTQKKSLRVLWILVGVIGIILSASYLFELLDGSYPRPTFGWIRFFVFLILGIIFLIQGFSRQKAYVLINGKSLSFKPTEEAKLEKINWSDVASITYKHNKFHFTKKNNTVQVINLSSLSFALVSEVKGAVSSQAKAKNISINLT